MFEPDLETPSMLYPSVRPVRHIVDPVAFVLAMVGGPVLVTLCSFWLFAIPVAALVLGGPIFLIVGVPVLLWHLGRHAPAVDRISLLALSSVACVALLAGMAAVVAGEPELTALICWYGLFGGIFAPLWGAMTGWLYIRLRREFYVDPLTL